MISLLATHKKYKIKQEKRDIKYLSKNIQEPINALEYYIKEGLRNRPELAMYEGLILANKQTLQSTKAQYYPKLHLKATYNNSDSKESSFDKTQNTLGLYLSWDLFTGFSTKASILKNKSSINQIQAKKTQEELRIQESISSAYILLLENVQSIKLSLINYELSKDNLFLSQERYKNGLNDIYELNSSKRQFTDALSSMIDIYYSYEISIANLEYASTIKYK